MAISFKANRTKSNGTLEEHEKILKYMKQNLPKDSNSSSAGGSTWAGDSPKNLENLVSGNPGKIPSRQKNQNLTENLSGGMVFQSNPSRWDLGEMEYIPILDLKKLQELYEQVKNTVPLENYLVYQSTMGKTNYYEFGIPIKKDS